MGECSRKTRSTITNGVSLVRLFNAVGELVGFATLEQVHDGVKVKITASGLTPGKHGFQCA